MVEDKINNPYNKLDEWAMSSMNPVIGTSKPFILKAVNDDESLINSKLYALSPDIISDKYLVVDENSKLSIVDKSYFDNYYLEVYEYIGNELNIGKIKEAYNKGDIVDPNFIYETLTGKKLLSEDQIDFDENFSKVDLDSINAKSESYTATMLQKWNEITGNLYSFPVLENASIALENVNFKWADRLSLMEDINGYYLENRLTHTRTKSVSSIDNITESMGKSIY